MILYEFYWLKRYNFKYDYCLLYMLRIVVGNVFFVIDDKIYFVLMVYGN